MEKYTKEHSTALKDDKKLFEEFIIAKHKEGYKIEKLIKYIEKKFFYVKSPNEWEIFLKNNNIQLDPKELKVINQDLV